MYKTYFVTTFRNIIRNKLVSILNVSGLAVGLAASILILKYVQDEFSYDQFHTNKDLIYRVQHNFLKGGQIDFQSARTFPKVGPAIEDEFPEVEKYCRLFKKYRGGNVQYEDVSFNEDYIFYADPSFLDMFSFELIEGDRSTVLKEAHTAVIEEQLAFKYFGDRNPIGKRIKVGSMHGLEEFEITGVIRSPQNSHLQFDLVLSYSSLISLFGEDADTEWGWYDFYTYLLLKPEADPIELESKLPGMVDKYGGDRRGSKRVELILQPLTSIHLQSDLMMEAALNGDANTVCFLAILAIAILLIAWINYLNMATAGAMERAREVGIKKVVGASKIQLGLQFIIEAAIINLLAIAVSFLLIYIVLPYYNLFTGYPLTASELFYNWAFWDKVLMLYLIGTLVSGIYPAFVLSSYQPVKVLKGEWKTSSHGLIMRKALVILQFSASIILITGTILVYQQIQFMQSRELGFNSDDVLIVKAPDVIIDVAQYNRNMESYKTELLRSEHIEQVTITSAIPGRKVGWYIGSKRIGVDQNDPTVTLYVATMDYDYFDLLDIQLITGRAYSKETGEDPTNVMINEKAVEMLGFGSAEESLQQKVVLFRDTLTVIGVVSNYFHQSPKEDFSPTAYRLMEAERNYFAIRMETGEYHSVLSNAERIYASLFPGYAFDYFFLDDFYKGQYDTERKFNNVFNTFSVLAVIIASLGLFALASYTIAQRTKEVGIRKVLGASVSGIFLLFIQDFLKLIFIANGIAMPVVLLVMNNWLNSFAQRITIGAGVFVLAAFIAIMLALLSIVYHAIKATRINPVKALRSD